MKKEKWEEKAICPECGCKDFLWKYDVSTVIPVQTIIMNGSSHLFVNGQPVDKDPNTLTHYVRCTKCGKNYEVEDEK